MEKTKVAIIGCGTIANVAHGPSYQKNPDVKLAYCVDIIPERAQALKEKFGTRIFATPKKMGAQTAEANMNAGLAAARQIVDFFETGNTRFQVNGKK